MARADLRYRWRQTVASSAGPKSPITRHVLITLSLRMDADGRNCFPSTRLLEEETALTRKTVETHLARAAETGWIQKASVEEALASGWVTRAGPRGRGWRRTAYLPTFPKVEYLLPHDEPEGGVPHAGEVESPVLLSSTKRQSTRENGGQMRETIVGVAVEIGIFCERIGRDWDLVSMTPEEWVEKRLLTNASFSGLDLCLEVGACGDHWEGLLLASPRKKKPKPSRAVLNWMKKAVQIRAREAERKAGRQEEAREIQKRTRARSGRVRASVAEQAERVAIEDEANRKAAAWLSGLDARNRALIEEEARRGVGQGAPVGIVTGAMLGIAKSKLGLTPTPASGMTPVGELVR